MNFSGFLRISTTPVLMLFLTTSCRTFAPDSKIKDVEQNVPENYILHSQSGYGSADNRWWNSFSDTNISRLINQALAGNLSIRQADARLRAAEAVAIQRGATRLPDLSVEGKAGVARQLTMDAEGNASPKNVNTYSLSAVSSYELDLWGRVRAGHKAAQMELEATRADLETAAMTIAAETTTKYMNLMQQRQKIDLIRAQEKNSLAMLELIELRQKQSQATALAVYQQRESVARISALIPPVTAIEESLLQELTALLGLPVNSNIESNSRILPATAPLPQPGLPVDLLTRRPDIKAARMRLQSSEWQVSAAIADRLPTIRLSASAGYQSDNLASLFDDWISNLAASITGPIFDGSRRRAEVERTKAVADQLLASYHETILKAATEVQNAINQEARQAELIVALESQLEAADNSFNEALTQYRNGAESYLPALTADINRQNVSISLIQAQHDRLVWRIKLYRAIGGNWLEILEKGN